MRRRPPRSKRTDTLFPYTTLCRSRTLGLRRYILRCGLGFADRHARCRGLDLGALVRGAVCGRLLGELRLDLAHFGKAKHAPDAGRVDRRSEEHTSELPSLMRISYAVFCLKKKKQHTITP